MRVPVGFAALAVSENTFEAAFKRVLTFLFAKDGTFYEDFNFGTSVEPYKLVIFALTVGLAVASCVMTYKRRVPGRFVRALAAAGAVGSENAKMLSEIGFSADRAVLRSLKSGTLSRMLGCAERDKHDKELRASLESAKKGEKTLFTEYRPRPEKDSFYLPEDTAAALEKLFSDKNSGIGSLALTLLLCIVMAALLYVLVPRMLAMLR